MIFAFWFFLPAGIANASPVFANKIPLLNKWSTPLDFGQTHNGKPIFGKNKTWRGLVFGTFMGSLTGTIIYALHPNSIIELGVNPASPVLFMAWLGALLGFGALLGDAIESFIKRQLSIKSGDAWFPFDQTDYIIGGILLSSLLVQLPALTNITILLLWFGLHLASSYIGFLLKLKDKPI